MNSFTVKLVGVLLSLFILINIGNQLYILLYSPYKTEIASEYKITDSIGFKGVYVRNEEVITYDGSGLLSYILEDGGKVAKDSPVAMVYGSASDVESRQKIEQYQAEIKLLEQSQSPGATDSAKQEDSRKHPHCHPVL